MCGAHTRKIDMAEYRKLYNRNNNNKRPTCRLQCVALIAVEMAKCIREYSNEVLASLGSGSAVSVFYFFSYFSLVRFGPTQRCGIICNMYMYHK